ncbi:hypothetical protein G7Z17_g5834 [Cylindrodendrum hubeiense]|uniref:Uncharacterized protein n=1 Tax=Cylindrodendrum hubeiense TaxID=595255 RepID=A0A9P5HDF7_9HYPO|nr:hypothetical protein G7Z17_g5834 [Cylindrodendrum hubeiense]
MTFSASAISCYPRIAQFFFPDLAILSVSAGRQNADTLARLEKTKEQLTEATNDFIKCRHQAYGTYLADPAWAKTFYPAYQLASLRKDATSQEAYEAHLEYYGPQTASLWNDRVQLDQAFVANSLNKPYNMPTSTAQVTRDAIVGSGPPPAPLDITYQPRYNIDDKFSEEALSWVLNAKNGNNKPLEITVKSSSTSNAKPADWNDLGFSQVSLENHHEVLARVPLFTAHTHEVSTSTHQPNLQVGLEGKRTSAEVTIRASDAAVFTLGPDQSCVWARPKLKAMAAQVLASGEPVKFGSPCGSSCVYNISLEGPSFHCEEPEEKP